jgi:hypothetical protein
MTAKPVRGDVLAAGGEAEIVGGDVSGAWRKSKFCAERAFYSAAPPLDNSRYRFESVALAATNEVGLLGNELLPRCSARLRQ